MSNYRAGLKPLICWDFHIEQPFRTMHTARKLAHRLTPRRFGWSAKAVSLALRDTLLRPEASATVTTSGNGGLMGLTQFD